MRIYQRIGPNTGISYSPWFWFLVFVGAFPFIVIGLAFYVMVWGLAIVLMVLLAIYGIVYHAMTGKNARIPVPGSTHGTRIEYFMEDQGWIKLPRDLQPVPPWLTTHTRNTLPR